MLDITQLDEVEEVLEASGFMKSKWLHLGLKLGLLAVTLHSIEAQYHGDVDRCLLECLLYWLKRSDNVVNKGGPHWISLISSLRGIGENSVADELSLSKSTNTYNL